MTLPRPVGRFPRWVVCDVGMSPLSCLNQLGHTPRNECRGA